MAFPPFKFAGQGNPFVAPPGGPVTPAAQLDQNFAACAPTIAGSNYPQGSDSATSLAQIAFANVVPVDGRGTLLRYAYWTPQDKGALCNGVANDATPVFNANLTGAPLAFTAPITRIATTLHLSVPVTVQPGAVIRVDGVALYFEGSFSAGHAKCFDCINGGQVIFGNGVTPEAYPEWWGARADGATNSLAAFNAALAAHDTVRASRGTYLVPGTLLISSDARALLGAGDGHTILSSSSTADHILVQNGSNYTSFPLLKGFSLVRTVEPTSNPTTPQNSSCGIRMVGAVRGIIEDVTIYNSAIGRYATQTASMQCTRVRAIRNTTGVSSDIFYGVWFDGTQPPLTPGLTLNASFRDQDCVASVTGFVGTTSFGAYAAGSIADLFLINHETGGLLTGIHLEGGSGYSDNIDVHIINPIIDNIQECGIRVSNLGRNGAVSITEGYTSIGAVGSATAYCVDINNSDSVTLDQSHQQISHLAATGAIGTRIRNSAQVSASPMVKDCTFGLVCNLSTDCDLAPRIMRNGALAATGYGISIAGAGGGHRIAPAVGGDTNAKYSFGVVIDNLSTANVLDLTRVRVGPNVAKAQINSVTVTGTGAYSGNTVLVF